MAETIRDGVMMMRDDVETSELMNSLPQEKLVSCNLCNTTTNDQLLLTDWNFGGEKKRTDELE